MELNNNNKRRRRRNKRTILYLKRKIIQRKRTKPISPTLAYPIDVNTVAKIQSITQPQNNFTYSLSGSIYENLYFQKYADLYQEFKIKYTQIHIVPVQRAGDQPPVMYAIVLANEELTVQYSQIPSLPGTTKISGRGVTQMLFNSTGRTDDLNRWYNTKTDKPNFLLKLHSFDSIGTTDDSPHYFINVRSRVIFRRPIIIEQNTKIIEEAVEIKAKNNPQVVTNEWANQYYNVQSDDN